jgi:predicted transglutaminase-like cysteine proteinase
LPALANPPAEPASGGSIELPNARSIDPVVDEMFPRWPAVRIYLANEQHRPDGSMRELTDWAQSLRGEPELQRLRAINDKVNGLLAYDTDTKLWHEADYWELPGEALSRGAADCEGFAIFKMYLAKEAGLRLEQMAILVGSLGYNREPHAVLGAKVGPKIVTLDNKTASIVTLGGKSEFTPLYSVGVRGAYTYPLNWGSGNGVDTVQAADDTGARVVTASRQAADDALTIVRPAAAAADVTVREADTGTETAAIEPAAAVTVTPASAEAAAAGLPLPPRKPETPRNTAVALAEAEPAFPAPSTPKKGLFGGGALDQMLSFVFQ